MIDRERVIKGLECISEWLFQQYQVVYDGDASNYYDAYKTVDDAIALLKEQKAKPVKIVKNAYDHEFYYCPNCDRQFYDFYKKPVYCDRCGQAVKWQ